MRIIDADALIEDLHTVHPRYKDIVFWVEKIINAQPTVDVRIPVQIIKPRGDEDGIGENN